MDENGAGVLTVDKKANWGDMYRELSPKAYYETLSPLDYGHYHDRFLEIIQTTLEAGKHSDDCIEVVELGSSYGNTTVAYRCGLDWLATGNIWLDDTKPLVPIYNMHVTACDISEPALKYGLGRGIFDRTFTQDFNQDLHPDLVVALDRSDMLFCIMVSAYITTPSLERCCSIFLGDRRKRKIFAYNIVCVFDHRNLSPECLFAGVENWTSSSYFTKHRNFTEDESLCHHGCKESWTYTYVVTFEPIL